MDFLQQALRNLPQAARSTYAFIAYLAVIIAWVTIALQVNPLDSALKQIQDIPEDERRQHIETLLQRPVPPELSLERWLQSRRDSYYFYGFLVLCGAGIVVFGIAVAKRNNSKTESNSGTNDKRKQGTDSGINIGEIKPSSGSVNIENIQGNKIVGATPDEIHAPQPGVTAGPEADKSDEEVVEDLYGCFNRPAFRDSFEHESDLEALMVAFDDTIAAINTGVKKTRDGIVFGTAGKGKAYFDNPELYSAFDQIVTLLGEAKTLYSKAKEAGYFFFGVRSGAAFHGDYQGEAAWVAIKIDELRNDALKIANRVYEQMGKRPFPYIKTPEHYHRFATPPPFAKEV